MEYEQKSRRKMLAALGSIGATVVAGCSGDDGGDSSSTESGQSNDNNSSDSSSGGGSNDETATAEESFLGDVTWGQREADAARTGVVDVEGPTADSLSSYSFSLPDYFNSNSYVHYHPVFTENAFVYKGKIFDKRTGREIRQLGGERTTPAVADGQIYSISGGNVIAFNPIDVQIIWETTTISNGNDIIVSGDKVLVALEDGVTALSASDGSQLWSISKGYTPPSGGTGGQPAAGFFAASGDTLYIASEIVNNNDITAHNISDGSQRWSMSERHGMRTQEYPCVGPDGNLYVYTESDSLVKFSPEGEMIWNTDAGGADIYAVDNARIYSVIDTVGNNGLTAIDKEDGSELWSNQQVQSVRDIAVAANGVYVGTTGDESSRLFVLDKQSGDRIGLYSISDFIAPRSIAVSSGVISVGNPSQTENRMKIFHEFS